MSEPLWAPGRERIERAQVTAFRHRAAAVSGRDLPDYDALWAWSVDEIEAFWKLVWDELDVVASEPPVEVLDRRVLPGAHWFEGARLNFAENLLVHRGERAALVAFTEAGGEPEVLSRDELRLQVAHLQAWFAELGVGVGDCVAGWLPNRSEAVVAMLATSALGAIWSSSSPDFGVSGVVDRFGQIAPKVLLVAQQTRYAGKVHDLLDKARSIAAALPSLQAVVVVGAQPAADLGGLPGATRWERAIAQGPDEPTFAQLPFEHPLYVLYSSGTTGVPKCIVHGQGGTLLQHKKELVLHTDLSAEDVLFYFTTTGWMMWNWLVSGLACGATVVLWDGSPVHPAPDALWSMAARLGVTVFGTSPKFLTMCEKEGLTPGRSFNLSQLRTVLSTGSPLTVENAQWVAREVGDVQLASICGGTDIVSCFMLGVPTEPVYAGEIQRRGLGMKVEAWTPEGQPVVGQKAELVCTLPFPSMPVEFWNDPDQRRYRAAYFETFPGVWHHGDWIELNERGGVVVHGRSDSTLNPGGVRIGTAEVYRPVEAVPGVLDSVVVGLPDGADVEIVLFVVLAPGVVLDERLQRTLRTRVREMASPRHVPSRIFTAPAIPRTLSGKKVEVAVLQALNGQIAPNRDALANPEALDWFARHGRAAVQRPE